jgi:hypothetical protein
MNGGCRAGVHVGVVYGYGNRSKKNRILDKVKGVSTDEDVDDTQQYTAHLGNIAHCLDESFSGFTEFHVFLS